MIKVLIIAIIFSFHNPALSSSKNKIISNIKLTNNFNFNFIQTIGEQKDNGICVIKYPKKIFCKYEKSNKKIIVSNGKSLVIKYQSSGSYYIYPLKRTPLEFLLDKDYLISKINNLDPISINNKYFNFIILENNNKINIYFDKKKFYLAGWQTEDIYQNITSTFISSIKINGEIDDKVFILPNRD